MIKWMLAEFYLADIVLMFMLAQCQTAYGDRIEPLFILLVKPVLFLLLTSQNVACEKAYSMALKVTN